MTSDKPLELGGFLAVVNSLEDKDELTDPLIKEFQDFYFRLSKIEVPEALLALLSELSLEMVNRLNSPLIDGLYAGYNGVAPTPVPTPSVLPYPKIIWNLFFQILTTGHYPEAINFLLARWSSVLSPTSKEFNPLETLRCVLDHPPKIRKELFPDSKVAPGAGPKREAKEEPPLPLHSIKNLQFILDLCDQRQLKVPLGMLEYLTTRACEGGLLPAMQIIVGRAEALCCEEYSEFLWRSLQRGLREGVHDCLEFYFQELERVLKTFPHFRAFNFYDGILLQSALGRRVPVWDLFVKYIPLLGQMEWLRTRLTQTTDFVVQPEILKLFLVPPFLTQEFLDELVLAACGKEGTAESMRLILEKGAGIGRRAWTYPACAALAHGDLPTLKLLLERGVTTNAVVLGSLAGELQNSGNYQGLTERVELLLKLSEEPLCVSKAILSDLTLLYLHLIQNSQECFYIGANRGSTNVEEENDDLLPGRFYEDHPASAHAKLPGRRSSDWDCLYGIPIKELQRLLGFLFKTAHEQRDPPGRFPPNCLELYVKAHEGFCKGTHETLKGRQWLAAEIRKYGVEIPLF